MSDQSVTSSSHDRAVVAVLEQIRAFTDAMDRMHSGKKSDMDMNATDLAALRMLVVREQRGQSVSPHELAHHLRISTASTTKMLDRLSASGHVVREPHPHDRRARVVLLTDASRRAFFQTFGSTLAAMRGVAQRYTEEELGTIAQFLKEVGDAVDSE